MAGLIGAWGFLSREDTWMKGALDAAQTGTVLVFSAGNTGFTNASARSAMAYARPELEANWLAVTAIRQNLSIGGTVAGQTLNPDGSVNVPGAHLYNQCGLAKWSCMSAPGNAINGSTVTLTGGVPTATYAALSGTSMAAPHASRRFGGGDGALFLYEQRPGAGRHENHGDPKRQHQQCARSYGITYI